MIHFDTVSLETFLSDYWQKKPLVFRNAIPGFINPLDLNDVAGFALEETIETRMVLEKPQSIPAWELKTGPFTEKELRALPPTHWTLLVQSVDQLVPEIAALWDEFNFLPRWRIDDIMISIASLYGSVGPHYDNYDVFLYQAKGRREWSLTTQNCTQENYIPTLTLRIMQQFLVEERIVLEEGDMLYLPSFVGHHGVSLSEECMTFSFGYRSYQARELLGSVHDYLEEKNLFQNFYQDPDWRALKNTFEITPAAVLNIQKLLHQVIDDQQLIKNWFGCFVTQMSSQAEPLLLNPLSSNELMNFHDFIKLLEQGHDLHRNLACRIALHYSASNTIESLYINGDQWDIEDLSPELIILINATYVINNSKIRPYLEQHEPNQRFLYQLWKLQWLELHQD